MLLTFYYSAYDRRVNKKKLPLLIVCIVTFVTLFFGFSPYNLPLFFVVLPMVPLTTIVILLTSFLLERLHVKASLSRKVTIVAGITTGVTLVLMSLGQLTLKDFTILFLFGAVGTFYVSRMFSDT